MQINYSQTDAKFIHIVHFENYRFTLDEYGEVLEISIKKEELQEYGRILFLSNVEAVIMRLRCYFLVLSVVLRMSITGSYHRKANMGSCHRTLE